MAQILKCWKVLSMVTDMERKTWPMKHPLVLIFAIGVMGLLPFSRVGATSDGAVAPGSFTAGASGKIDGSALKNNVVGQSPFVPPESSTQSNVFRDIPSLSGNSLGGGSKLTPYIGAGFGSGYASDLDRSLSGGASTQADSGSRSHFGQGLTPSEFQMGIRIPF
jgi:hypothetical protein